MLTKMKTKIIYIAFMPLTEKIYREWFVSFLRERGYDVEYWNLSPFLQGLKDENGLQDDRITRFFYSFREFEAGLAALKTDATVCVMLMGYGERFVPVYRLMTKYRRRMVYLAWGYIPWQRARRLKEKVSLFANPARLAKKLFFKIRAVAYRKLGLVAPYDVVFSSSPSIAAANFNVRKIVPINSLDYDRFIEGGEDLHLETSAPFAVFLDIFLPHQSDLVFSKTRTIDADRYYSSLNRFFDLIEEVCGICVVIAAHPKAKYADDRFGGRKIFYGKTPALVKCSSFVISHNSTSISFAILAQKPAVFIYTQEMDELYQNTTVSDIKTIAGFIGASAYNIDGANIKNEFVPPFADHERYEAYKRDFLVASGAGDVPGRDVFFKEIRRLIDDQKNISSVVDA